MLRICELVYDNVVQGTTAVYTDPKWNEKMGTADMVLLSAIASQFSGTSPTLTVTAETSADGIYWGEWAGGPLVNAVALSGTDKVGTGSNGYFNNGLRYMRLKIELGGTDPSTRLQLWWAGRDYTK